MQDIVRWAHPSLPSDRHLDRLSRFCKAHERDQQTDIQTDHATKNAAIGRILRTECMRCGLKYKLLNGRRALL